MMKALRDRKRAGILGGAVAVGLIAALPASEGFACGYDDPQTVSRGFLNWIYPDSLFVIGAISKEVAARRLPLSNFDRGGPADLFGHKFLLAKTSLEQFGAMLDAASPEPLRTPVAVVLVEPMLWARFQPTADGLRIAVHVSGAERGDLVVITGEAVIAEIAARRLTFREAYARGIVRLYGGDAEIAAFLRSYEQVGANPGALVAKAKSTLAPASIAADASPPPTGADDRTAGESRTSEKLIQ
jgi:hypothetical protein